MIFSGVTSVATASPWVASRPSSWSNVAAGARQPGDQLAACTGMRIVRDWSAIARLMACRIHHVA